MSPKYSKHKVFNVLRYGVLISGFNMSFSTGPSYTPTTVDLVASEIESFGGCNRSRLTYDVVELGAGTGNMTESLRPKLPRDCRYLALEPSQDFVDILRSKYLDVEVFAGPASAIPSNACSVKNIVCAQSFHWFSDKKHLEEIRRVLEPGGQLIVVVNMKNFDCGWMKAVYEQRKVVFERTRTSMNSLLDSMMWKEVLNDSPLFSLKMHRTLPGVEMCGNVDEVLQNLTAVSAYKKLSLDQLAAYLRELRATLVACPGLDLDNINIPFSTEVYVYRAQ